MVIVSNPFEDFKVLEEYMKKHLYEPVGITIYPDKHWELWYYE